MHGFLLFKNKTKQDKKPTFFSWPWSLLIRLFYLFPSFSSKFLKSVVCPTSSISWPLTHSFLTCRLASINILLLKMCSQGHQWSSCCHSPPSPHSPLPFSNLDHQSHGPMFLLLGKISHVYPLPSISNDRTLRRTFSSTYFWPRPSLAFVVCGHHVNLNKTLISHHFLIQQIPRTPRVME